MLLGRKHGPRPQGIAKNETDSSKHVKRQGPFSKNLQSGSEKCDVQGDGSDAGPCWDAVMGDQCRGV